MEGGVEPVSLLKPLQSRDCLKLFLNLKGSTFWLISCTASEN